MRLALLNSKLNLFVHSSQGFRGSHALSQHAPCRNVLLCELIILLPAFIQTELVTSEKMASTLSPENLTNMSTNEQLPNIYDPIWAMILRWILATIIVTVGMHLHKIFDCTFNRLVLTLIRHLRTTLITLCISKCFNYHRKLLCFF